MSQFIYTSWFRDTSADPEDQDYEWCACFVISAETDHEVVQWGDHLAAGYQSRHPYEKFLHSYVEPASSYSHKMVLSLPQVAFGIEASDEIIGW